MILFLIYVDVDVDCGLTSHSAIFQLYSDGVFLIYNIYYLCCTCIDVYDLSA